MNICSVPIRFPEPRSTARKGNADPTVQLLGAASFASGHGRGTGESGWLEAIHDAIYERRLSRPEFLVNVIGCVNQQICRPQPPFTPKCSIFDILRVKAGKRTDIDFGKSAVVANVLACV